MIKRYSVPTEILAENLISALAPVETELEWNKLTTTETTHAIVCLGFQNKQTPILDADGLPTYDADGTPLVDVIEGTTYDVDIIWKDEPLEAFNKYESNPITPNHNFA